MARITNISNEYIDSMRGYLDHLEAGGADLLVSPPATGITILVDQLFTDSEFIQAFFIGCLGAWASGVFIGQAIKYLAKLK